MKKDSQPLRPPRRSLRIIQALVLLGVVSGVLSATAEEVVWQPTYEKALEESKTQQKPLLVDFTAEWCGWCKKMDAEVYSTPEVSGLLKDFICVKVDIEKSPETALAYQVQSIPRTIILNSNKEIITDQLGFSAASDFLELLKEAKSWKPGDPTTQIAPNVEAPAAPEGDAPETIDSSDAAAKLLTMLASQNVDVRKRAEETLAKVVPQMLPTLVKALASDVLAERIAANDALRKYGHDVAPFEPWASREERDKAFKAWGAWLAAQPAAPPAESPSPPAESPAPPAEAPAP